LTTQKNNYYKSLNRRGNSYKKHPEKNEGGGYGSCDEEKPSSVSKQRRSIKRRLKLSRAIAYGIKRK